MNQFILLFEVSGEFPTVQGLYLTFFILGGVGFALSFWRWWAGVFWLVFPMSIILALHLWINIEDINSVYQDVIKELGEIYIWHNYFSMTLTVLLNIVGIFLGFFRQKKLILQ